MRRQHVSSLASIADIITALPILLLITPVTAIRMLESRSLSTCMPDSEITATYLHAVFTPDNKTLEFHIDGESQVKSNVTIQVTVYGYGYNAFSDVFNPCNNSGLKGICPMNAGPIPDLISNLQVPQEQVNQVPNIVYYIPDLDGKIVAWFNDSSTNKPLACVECDLSNGKTVYQASAAWSIGILTLLCLVSAAILWCKGFGAASAHLAAKCCSLVMYYQAVAAIGLASQTLPPIVRAWTQNFQWTIGLIRLGFLQHIATWYLRASGGQPNLSSLVSTISNTPTSVRVQKRTNSASGSAFNMNEVTVRGIQRACYVANVDVKNFFITGYMWFVIVVMGLVGGVLLTGFALRSVATRKSKREEKWETPRKFWRVQLKGLLFRFLFFSFFPLSILIFYELRNRDSSAEIVLGVFTFLGLFITMGLACFKIIRLQRQSLIERGNSGFYLYSNWFVLNKLGFLFSPYKADCSWFLAPTLFYFMLKGAFVGISQSNSTALTLGVASLDVIFLIITAFFRPYLDKSVNKMNIAVGVVNVLNAGLLLEFSNIFHKPALATGVCGIMFFFINLPFLAFLLISTLITAFRSLVTKCNPDCCYGKDIKDDRASFMPNQAPFSVLRKVGSTADFIEGESVVAKDFSVVGESKQTLGTAVGNYTTSVIARNETVSSIARTEITNKTGSTNIPNMVRIPTAGISTELAELGITARRAGFPNASGRSLSYNVSSPNTHPQIATTGSYSLSTGHLHPPPSSSGTGHSTQSSASNSQNTNMTNISRSSDVLPLQEFAIAFDLGVTNRFVSSKAAVALSSAPTSYSPSPLRKILPQSVAVHCSSLGQNAEAVNSEEISPTTGVTSQEVSYADNGFPVLDREEGVDGIEEISPRSTWIAPTVRTKLAVRSTSQSRVTEFATGEYNCRGPLNDSVTISSPQQPQKSHVNHPLGEEATLALWQSPAAKHEEQVRKLLRKGGHQKGNERGGYGVWWKGSFSGK